MVHVEAAKCRYKLDKHGVNSGYFGRKHLGVAAVRVMLFHQKNINDLTLVSTTEHIRSWQTMSAVASGFLPGLRLSGRLDQGRPSWRRGCVADVPVREGLTHRSRGLTLLIVKTIRLAES